MTGPAPDAVAAHVLAAHERLAVLLRGLTDEDVRAPSALPGWSRAHVLSHVEQITNAMARQAEHAVARSAIEVYDGGRPARDAAIEHGASRRAAELADAVRTSAARLARVWAPLSERDWARPVAYRDGVLADTATALWREVEIHTADLRLGEVRWSPELCHHLWEFLAPRVPDGVRLTLAPVGFAPWSTGDGTAVVVRGDATDVTSWLAGRDPAGPLAVEGVLPDLLPWP
ncbi:maleylpyruvate isomerase family mycothiol-dependent enzyme [Umezawaea beigongshangensis]|uniref:maleylpyruvate isomerase family mycothiol-dependent enzyme n=1 Tax=Umezawaea beigongshangensis TaxID=2780383 RepID=UPI0018F1379B|nr:maleylpyruvate isomerase family mycothiol-dependent enzyme [Umezawaea beigongshangensis]